MVRTVATASAALAFLSAVNALTFDDNAKAVAFDFHKRTSQDAPQPGLRKRAGSTVAENLTWGNLLYYINITLGTPGQPSAVWLDTGSSDLWLPDLGSNICNSQVGCSNNGGFDPTKSSSYQTIAKNQFQISYASGDQILGDYGQDKLSMDNANLEKVIFGVARQGQTSEPLSGIMGIGYRLGEAITSESASGQSYPNIVDDLVNAGIISSHTYSLYLNDIENGHGTILFGGVDTAKYSGELGIVDVQQNSATGNFDTFTVVLSKMSFTAGGKTNNLNLGGGLGVILDSGTTLTYMPNNIATAIYDGLGISYDDLDGPFVPCNVDTSNMFFTFTFGSEGGVPLQIDLGQFVLPFDPQEQLPPQADGTNSCVFGLYPAGTVSNGQGDILFGDTFLRSAYLVYDLDNNQIAIGQTKFDVSNSQVKAIAGSGAAAAVSSGAGLGSLGPTSSAAMNTIPGATTVTAQASISQANSDLAGQSPGLGGAASTSAINTVPTSVAPTFQGLPQGGLQTGTTTAGNGPASTSSSAASAVRRPKMDIAGFATVGACSLVALVAGSAFMMTL